MELEFIDMRDTLPSGGSIKVTIPMKIVKELWRKAEERLSTDRPGALCTFIEKFYVCFIRSDGKVILELPENVMKSKDYPEKLRNKVKEEWLKYQKRLLAKECDDIYEDLARGKISEREFDTQFDNLKKRSKEMARSSKSTFSERELHFIATDELGQLLAEISMDEEREKEENFLALIEEIKKIINEANEIKNMIEKLEKSYEQRKISKARYEIIKESLQGKLVFAERRLNKFRKIVCNIEGNRH